MALSCPFKAYLQAIDDVNDALGVVSSGKHLKLLNDPELLRRKMITLPPDSLSAWSLLLSPKDLIPQPRD